MIAAVLSSNADPARDPKRTINNFTVDLTPLIKWWHKHDGERPLTAWIHLTGPIVATNGGAWVIEGKPEDPAPRPNSRAAESSANSGSETVRVLLIHPPTEDAAEFQRLVARQAQLNQTQAALASGKAQAQERDQAVTQLERTRRRNRAQSRVLAAEDKQLKNAESRADAEQKPGAKELNEIKTKLAAYPKQDQYILDCFALDMHSEYQRMPIYDYGYVLR